MVFKAVRMKNTWNYLFTEQCRHKLISVFVIIKLTFIVPEEAITHAYVKHKIYIPYGNQCYCAHIIKHRLCDSDLNSIRIVSNISSLCKRKLNKLFQTMTIESVTPILKKIRNLNVKQIQLLTGLDFEDIEQLRNMMMSMRDNEYRTMLEAIFVFLVKLRTGNSNKMISAITDLEREQMISDYSVSIINAFEKDILPFHFSIRSNSRQDLIDNHTTDFAKKLYSVHDKLLVICNGTYARHQKSSNNEYQ